MSTHDSNKPKTKKSEDSSAFKYAHHMTTSICEEISEDSRPFVAKSRHLHGYDQVELAANCRFSDCVALMFTGELPAPEQSKALEIAMIGIMHLGPRDAATRAAMVAGVSKTKAQHLLPVGLMTGGGARQGAAEVEEAHNFIKQHHTSPVREFIEGLNPDEIKIAGFGQRYGQKDFIMEALLSQMTSAHPSCPVLHWVNACHQALEAFEIGILDTGLIAAVAMSLGIGKRESIGLYQIARAPGIFAQGIEQSHKPITAIPMLSDEEVRLVRE